MLARLAENLFWAGRYAERAEDTARMVDVTYHTLLESPPAEERLAWSQLLEVLHLDQVYSGRQETLEPSEVIHFLVSDEDNPGSVLASVTRARDNIRSVRELVSSELWEAANALYLQLRARDVRAELDRPYELFSLVKRGGQTITGVATETMPRDDGWRFLTLGRMLERAEMTSRLLNVRHAALLTTGGEMAFHQWVAILKSVSASEAFRRAYRSSMAAAHVVEFLLLSPTFPRSVLFCLQTAEAQLARLDDGASPGRARRTLGRLRSEVEFANADELLAEGLEDLLDRVQDGVARTTDAVAAEFFQHATSAAFQPIATS